MILSASTTAVHGAGHTVAYRRLFPEKLMYGVAIVFDDEQGWVGWSSNGYEYDHATAEAEFDAYGCAGYAAVLIAGYSEDEAAAGCGNDFSRVHGDLAVAKVKAIDLMRRPENVKAVNRIADELMRRQRLHPDHVEQLINLSDGEVTESEYQEMLSFRGWCGDDPTLEPDALQD
jgi:hypothetical protein